VGYQQVDTLAQLRRRRERAGPADTTTGIFFHSVMDAVKARRGAPALEAMLRERGLSGRWVGLLRYPVREYLSLLEAGLLTIGSEAELNDNLVQLGVDAARAFRESPIGQVFERANAGAVHRVLAGVRLAYAATSSFGVRTYQRVGEREGHLRSKGDWVGPAGALGAILGGVTSIGGAPVTATVEDVEDDGSAYRVRVVW
jgi:uncharacterized protein (TIGR02265 family)